MIDWIDNETPEMGAAWFPVAWSHEVTDKPIAVQLLGKHWVVVRLNGELTAFVDRCPHRLIPLSGGEICEGTLRCAYHGWRFNAAGETVAIPSHSDGTPIPPRARVDKPAGIAEQYGAVWLAPLPPITPIPPYPEWDDPEFEVRLDIPYYTEASAWHFTDNGCDASHFFMVHRNTFGGDETAMVFPRSVERNGWSVTGIYESPYKVLDDPEVIAGRADALQISTQSKTFHLGSSVVLRMEFPASNSTFTIMTSVQPERVGSTRTFRWFARNDIVGDEERWADCLDIEAKVILEDCAALGLYRDHRLPLDTQVEVHTRSDKLSVAYRRLLWDVANRDSGVEAPPV